MKRFPSPGTAGQTPLRRDVEGTRYEQWAENMPRHPVTADGNPETLHYVHSMLGQLRGLSESGKYDLLTYLIDMAYIEAGDIIRGERPSFDRQQKRDSAA